MDGLLNETVKRVQLKKNLKIDSAINDFKSTLLEQEKPHLNEEIIYFLEEDLGDIEDGFSKQTLDNLHAPIYKAKRSLLEYLQIQRHPINYCVLTYTDKKDKKSYLVIHREKGSGESRLIGLKGLLGGHVGKDDIVLIPNTDVIDLESTLHKSLMRELNEEAGITESIVQKKTFYGFINIKEECSVENDHLGIISIVDTNTKNIKTLEDGIISGSWVTEEEIIENIDQYEKWAKIIFTNLFNL